VWDPKTGRWSEEAASLAAPHYAHSATLLPDGRVVVAGGVTQRCKEGNCDTDLTPTIEVRDPTNQKWSRSRPLAHARANHATVLLPDGRLFVVGGDAVYRREIWEGTSEILSFAR
jgi:hypothetical protein